MQVPRSKTKDLGQMVCRNPKAKWENRLWLGTFTNSVEGARAYDEVARILYVSRARLNFPIGLDSTTTSNYSEIPLRNEDGESIVTSSAQDITCVSPNVMIEEGEGELRADFQHSVVAETNMPTIKEDLPMMDKDELFDLDSIPELFNDDFFKDKGSFFDNIGQLGCLDVDQCGKPSSDLTQSWHLPALVNGV
ncbi:ethylene-responsive transcription factor RAP2-1-like [Corylus avellana]|uniref:ethylene-responsive transcription factor RAP2-1-like n=1 Tax=Corylus avellana TaxID=13451 RepID=UPI001E2176CA|nr:ethylene-responsive transcription factor RAP2-1-like [Corylus avellana]